MSVCMSIARRLGNDRSMPVRIGMAALAIMSIALSGGCTDQAEQGETPGPAAPLFMHEGEGSLLTYATGRFETQQSCLYFVTKGERLVAYLPNTSEWSAGGVRINGVDIPLGNQVRVGGATLDADPAISPPADCDVGSAVFYVDSTTPALK